MEGFEQWLQSHPELYDKQPEEVAEISYAAGQAAQREAWLPLLQEVLKRGKAGQSDITMCCQGDDGYELRQRIETAIWRGGA